MDFRRDPKPFFLNCVGFPSKSIPEELRMYWGGGPTAFFFLFFLTFSCHCMYTVYQFEPSKNMHTALYYAHKEVIWKSFEIINTTHKTPMVKSVPHYFCSNSKVPPAKFRLNLLSSNLKYCLHIREQFTISTVAFWLFVDSNHVTS